VSDVRDLIDAMRHAKLAEQYPEEDAAPESIDFDKLPSGAVLQPRTTNPVPAIRPVEEPTGSLKRRMDFHYGSQPATRFDVISAKDEVLAELRALRAEVAEIKAKIGGA